jgi:hypothetical protein
MSKNEKYFSKIENEDRLLKMDEFYFFFIIEEG